VPFCPSREQERAEDMKETDSRMDRKRKDSHLRSKKKSAKLACHSLSVILMKELCSWLKIEHIE